MPSQSLPPLLRLENRVRSYAWGSRTYLATLAGRPSPAKEPEAELWIGAHSAAPSRVGNGDDRISLEALITERPEEILGGDLVSCNGASLPFLLKLLAAAEPLSIQVHPDLEQARAGFAREESRGVPRDAAARSYPDPRAKPELLCALEPFEALHGFRTPAQITRTLELLDAPELDPLFAALRAPAAAEALRGLLQALLLRPSSERRKLARAAHAAANHLGSGAPPEIRWISRLGARFPDDSMVLAPAFMNLVTLEPGQALYTGAGVVHSYLGGAAVELQASSDDVVRVGLTDKHVDAVELLRIAGCEPLEPRVLQPRANAPGVLGFEPTPSGLLLERLELGLERQGGATVVELDRSHARRGPALLVCTAGEAMVEAWCGRDGARERLRPTESVLLTAAASRCRLTGAATVFRAGLTAPDQPGGSR